MFFEQGKLTPKTLLVAQHQATHSFSSGRSSAAICWADRKAVKNDPMINCTKRRKTDIAKLKAANHEPPKKYRSQQPRAASGRSSTTRRTALNGFRSPITSSARSGFNWLANMALYKGSSKAAEIFWLLRSCNKINATHHTVSANVGLRILMKISVVGDMFVSPTTKPTMKRRKGTRSNATRLLWVHLLPSRSFQTLSVWCKDVAVTVMKYDVKDTTQSVLVRNWQPTSSHFGCVIFW